ncbi:hypothetical protein [Streptomyces sp. NPDC047000]|uniref:hypothetical protein n=1 Tax=Streptomyces sp. NPDC047000 TaxID=3155474 RepID=UPI003407D171
MGSSAAPLMTARHHLTGAGTVTVATTGTATAAGLSLLPPVSPNLRLPDAWSVLDKAAQHLPKEALTANARRWTWRWAQTADLLTRRPEVDGLPRQVAGGALLRLAVIGLCCEWPDLAPGPPSAPVAGHRSPDDPPEAVTRLWRALCLRLYRRPTVPAGPVLATWNWRLDVPSGRTGRPYEPADLLAPGALEPLYCWPSVAAAPELARLLATQTAMLAAVAGLPRSAADLFESGCPADRLLRVLDEVEAACETLRLLALDARRALDEAGPLSPAQRRVLHRVAAAPPGPRTPVRGPGVPGGRLPLALETPWLLLGGDSTVRRQGPPWSPLGGDTDREQTRLLALVHMVGRQLEGQYRRHPAARTAHGRAVGAWLASAREHACVVAACGVG